MIEFIILLFYVALLAVLGAFAWILLMSASAQNKEQRFSEKKGLFQWHFDKLLLAYKVKILKLEIKKRNISMESLHDIMNEALGTKVSNKHVLDEIEEEVKGEMKKAKEEVRKTSSK